MEPVAKRCRLVEALLASVVDRSSRLAWYRLLAV
uniref:Uncharacterized protein n=1 Tax=Arundo donax TaxID=35708 RepID=A0A0A9AFG9_ARUDO